MAGKIDKLKERLFAIGISRNSKSIPDYEAAKRMISKWAKDSREYDELIQAAVKYIGI